MVIDTVRASDYLEREDKARMIPVMVTENLNERNFSGPVFVTTTVHIFQNDLSN